MKSGDWFNFLGGGKMFGDIWFQKGVDMIRCVIVEDKMDNLEVLKEYVSQIPFLKIETCCRNAMEASLVIRNKQPDLVILKVEMPEISGIEVVKRMRAGMQVIFTSASTQYAVEGFNLGVTDYLLKPFGFDRFLIAVEKAREIIKFKDLLRESAGNEGDYISIKSGYKNHRILLSGVLFIEAMDNYIKIYTTTKVYVTLMNLKGVLKLLPPDGFSRIHRSYIVSLSKVKAFNKQFVTVGSRRLPVGKSYSSVFAAAMEG